MFQQSKRNDIKSGKNILNSTPNRLKQARHQYIINYQSEQNVINEELNWYSSNPTEEISIEEFEQFAIDRLQVLKGLEAASLKGQTGKDLETTYERLCKEFLNKPKLTEKSDNYYIMRKDYLSHFVLRLAFSKSLDLRNWFIKYETLLFKLRFSSSLQDTRSELIKFLGVSYQKVSPQEKLKYKDQLIASKSGGFELWYEQEDFFKIPFTKVLDLVGNRQVFVLGGYAFVPREYSYSWIYAEFKTSLSKGLEVLSSKLSQLDEEERLLPLLHAVTTKSFNTYDPSNYNKVDGEILAADIPHLKKHFPLCMATMLAGLNRDNHLKHDARLQLGLFLKGIGLPLEQALLFWRTSFNNLTDDEFNKNYSYGIRHSYGKEGHAKNYSPYSCEKIINNVPRAKDQLHGCPFKYQTSEQLQTDLQYKHPDLNNSEINQIVDLVKKKQYSVACTRYFELSHINTLDGDGTSLPKPISHPNMFYELSKGFEQLQLK